jgi:hypothetical protein
VANTPNVFHYALERKMMRKLVQLLIVSVMLTPLASMAGESSHGTCADFWRRTGPLREVISHGVVPVIGQSFVVEKLTVKSLYRQDGSHFLPRNIHENNCYFDRVLSPEVRTALIEAAQSAILANRGADPGSLFDAIFDATDSRLTELLSSESGLTAVLAYFEWSLHIVGRGHSGFGSLERDANSRGVHAQARVMVLLWLSYLDYLGVNGVGPALQHVKSQEAHEQAQYLLGNGLPFEMVQVCARDERDLLMLTSELKSIATSEHLELWDDSDETDRELLDLHSSARLYKAINIAAWQESGASFGVSNPGLPPYQIVVGFHAPDDGPGGIDALTLAGRVVSRLRAQWHVVMVPAERGALPIADCPPQQGP